MNQPPTLKADDTIEGFIVKSVTPVDEVRAVAYLLEHERSGARALHLHTDDTENLFSISLPTPPPDDSGVPHILEHAVLSGSRKFPVRDPFFEMVKMSMATFLNAMTGWDCTYYPVASNVRQDLFNLADVYFDAVFHPLLTEQTFKREGHHLAPANKNEPTGPLTINGIVYNEMKGSFSSPESRLYRAAARGLFPDTVYGRESGGDPDHIPDLTYADLEQFHATYYHPSNAFFLIYGNIPTVKYLAFLDARLNTFARREISPPITRQSRWAKPRSVRDLYPLGPDEPDTDKTYVEVGWLVGDATDPDNVITLGLLADMLVGNEAAPLKKAIIDSKLGRDMVGPGYECVGLETTFRVGLKGTEPCHVQAFEDLVMNTLKTIADTGIKPDWIDAAFHQASYHHLEIVPMFPLVVMDRTLDAWIYGVDPLMFLRMGSHLDKCKRRYEADPQLFNRTIREKFLDNPHRLTVILEPDANWQARSDAAFTERMNQVHAELSEDCLRELAQEAEELERTSGTPNTPEAVASLPQLHVCDLPARPRHIPTTVEKLDHGVTFLHNDVFANGVNYLQLDFNLAGLPADLWIYLPRYADAIAKLGAAGMDYEQIAHRTTGSTGGIGCEPYLCTHAADPARSLYGLRLSLKMIDDKIEPALAVMRDLVFEVDPRDNARMRDVLDQAGANYETDLVHCGAGTAGRHAARGLTPQGYLTETVSGLPQLQLTHQINEQFEERVSELADKIVAVRNFLLTRDRLTISFTGSNNTCETVRTALNDWIGNMRHGTVSDAPVGFTPYQSPPREGLAGPIQVAHCAQVMPAPHASHHDEPLVTIGAHLVQLEYLLSEIRFKGNAYGAWCRYSSLGSTMHLGSFSDPHIARTLHVFKGVEDYVRQAGWTQTDIDRAIIATAKSSEQPIRPGHATTLALHRHITGLTREVREQRHAHILAATAAETQRALLDLLNAGYNSSAVCVMSSREKLEHANTEIPDYTLAIEDILL